MNVWIVITHYDDGEISCSVYSTEKQAKQELQNVRILFGLHEPAFHGCWTDDTGGTTVQMQEAKLDA